MSGIYLIVWDEGNEQWGRILQPTKGGWPHLTLAYTGKHLNREELIPMANDALQEWALKPMTLKFAYVNSFGDRPGHVRHDVLIGIKECKQIEETRKKLFFEHEKKDLFFMREPHVTIGIYENVEEAQLRATEVNKLLPYQILITGVTVD
uniref:2'-5' RNA ligase superfamily protein n=1 Tax=Marseillevirus LCMAC101 TaxID=2506602 RepID=A0A481YTU1_9VIRU|nr:MAG: 2'-5' RNA ligase superfamily protein [Marseillevirus LCMAC101]